MIVKILIVIAIIIIIPFIIALFTKKEFAIEKEVVIDKPKHEVFTYLKFLKNQDSYNKWTMMDADLKKEFKGTDGTLGFVYGWEGKKAGKGEQELKKISEGERIDLELRFIKPFESTAAAYLTTEPVSANQTKVKWGMKGITPYPRNFMNLFMNNFLGNALQENLMNLKAILEKK